MKFKILAVAGVLLAADEQAVRVTTLNAPTGGAPVTRLRFTGEENPARAVFENVRVGIGVSQPAEKLDVAGAVKLGNAAAAADGTIRWTGTDFEGRKAGVWTSLTAGAATPPSAGTPFVMFGFEREFSHPVSPDADFLFPGWSNDGADPFNELQVRVPRAGTLKNLRFLARVNAISPSIDVTFTLRKNGADTALAVTVPGGQLSGADTSDSVAVAAGDRIAMSYTVSASASADLEGVVLTAEFE